MQIVLLKDVKNVGQQGDIKEVASGYARNFLMPSGFAALATKETLKQAEILKKNREVEAQKGKKEFEEAKERIQGKTIVIPATASDEGSLFASVGVSLIADAISEQLKVNLPEKYFQLEESIKKIGQHSVAVEREGERFEFIAEVTKA